MSTENEIRQLVIALKELTRASYSSGYENDVCIKCNREVMYETACCCELMGPRQKALAALELKTAKDIFRAERLQYFAEEKRKLAQQMEEEGFEFGGES